MPNSIISSEEYSARVANTHFTPQGRDLLTFFETTNKPSKPLSPGEMVKVRGFPKWKTSKPVATVYTLIKRILQPQGLVALVRASVPRRYVWIMHPDVAANPQKYEFVPPKSAPPPRAVARAQPPGAPVAPAKKRLDIELDVQFSAPLTKVDLVSLATQVTGKTFEEILKDAIINATRK